MQTRPSLSDMLAGLQKLRAKPADVPAPAAAPAVARPVAPARPVLPAVAKPAVMPIAASALPVQRLLDVLRSFAGFRSTPHLQRKLEKVFRDMGPEELSRWVDTLLADPARRELIALVEDLTNHETYFFRDTPQLDILEKHVLPELVQRKLKSSDKTIRIWSAACSTGEETWTLALMTLQALLNAGIAREVRSGEIWLPADWKLEVLGTDISRQAVRVAKAAAYRTEALASFRQFPGSYLRFFDDAPSAGPGQPAYRHVRESLRRHVRFELFNLVSAEPPCRNQDLVLCRNVLIYIDTAVHGDVQRMMAASLRPAGHLMLGVVDRLQPRELFNDRWFSRCVIHERK
ncbi:MAG: CheR family methyltransferase [Pedobacter sp.]|nr:CheR family methyltransferase [Pedobacter sp.]